VRWRPPDGLQLATATVSNAIVVLDAATGEPLSLARIGGMKLDWSPDGSKLASVGGVYSITSGFDATGNWWGAADGPAGAGPGSGDAANANVLFSPFLAAGCPH